LKSGTKEKTEPYTLETLCLWQDPMNKEENQLVQACTDQTSEIYKGGSTILLLDSLRNGSTNVAIGGRVKITKLTVEDVFPFTQDCYKKRSVPAGDWLFLGGLRSEGATSSIPEGRAVIVRELIEDGDIHAKDVRTVLAQKITIPCKPSSSLQSEHTLNRAFHEWLAALRDSGTKKKTTNSARRSMRNSRCLPSSSRQHR
jgi:hypothetical protein